MSNTDGHRWVKIGALATAAMAATSFGLLVPDARRAQLFDSLFASEEDVAPKSPPSKEEKGRTSAPGGVRPRPVAAALDAYKRSWLAYNAKDEAGYYAFFSDPMECWYSRRNLRVQEKRPAPFEHTYSLTRLEALEESDTYVVFRAWHTKDDGTEVRKTVAMRLVDSRWLIVAEAGIGNHECLPAYF